MISRYAASGKAFMVRVRIFPWPELQHEAAAATAASGASYIPTCLAHRQVKVLNSPPISFNAFLAASSRRGDSLAERIP